MKGHVLPFYAALTVAGILVCLVLFAGLVWVLASVFSWL